MHALCDAVYVCVPARACVLFDMQKSLMKSDTFCGKETIFSYILMKNYFLSELLLRNECVGNNGKVFFDDDSNLCGFFGDALPPSFLFPPSTIVDVMAARAHKNLLPLILLIEFDATSVNQNNGKIAASASVCGVQCSACACVQQQQ